MARYCSHTVILPDGHLVNDFVVEVNKVVSVYYPFTGEMHSTIYLDTPILISYRDDLEGKTISLGQLNWALNNTEQGDDALYAYRLTPCSSCLGDRFTMTRL